MKRDAAVAIDDEAVKRYSSCIAFYGMGGGINYGFSQVKSITFGRIRAYLAYLVDKSVYRK